MTELRVEYSSNNSGGHWWLNDEDWYALEKAGWKVLWEKDETGAFGPDEGGRWLGALATRAEREGLNLREAIDEWERVTGEDSAALGCSCCGPPHDFTFRVDGEYKDEYSPAYPATGERY